MASPLKHSGKSTPDVVRLLNAVVDVCLVYGIDETSTRELEILEEGDMQTCYQSLLLREIKLHFLQLLAPGKTYPERTCSPPLISPCTSPALSPSQSIDHCAEDSIAFKHSKLFNVEDLGLTWETVETVHWFMFPEGPRMCSQDLEPFVIPMLLTNIDGARSYAAGLSFTRPFFVQKPDGSRYYRFIPWKQSMRPPANSQLVYLPTCCVLLSKQPYFHFMKDVLSGFYDQLSSDEMQVDFWEALQQYTERLFLIPSPPPGRLAVEFQLPGFFSPLLVWPPRGDQYVDIRLNYPFLCLSVDNILQVVSALLTEQRIIFFSSLYPLLTYVIQCFLSYISPFDWRHPCVPILPQQLLEYLEAPGTNIMGCHSAIAEAEEFTRIEDAVVVYLDKDEVECRLVEPPSLPQLPHQAVTIFKQRFESWRKANFELEQIQRLSHLSVEELQKAKAKFERQQDDFLAHMFLELMVNIYNQVIEQLLHSRIKYDEAVKKMSTEDQEFYRYTSCTDMFSAFYQSRRQRTQRDQFTLLSERLKKLQRRSAFDDDVAASLGYTQVPVLDPSSPKSSGRSRNTASSFQSYISDSSFHPPSLACIGSVSSSTGSLEDSQPLSVMSSYNPPALAELVRLELPSLAKDTIDRDAFIDAVITSLDDLKQNRQVQPQCIFLKAFYRICQKHFVEALDDFYDTLQRLDVQLVPDARTMRDVANYLSPEQKDDFQSKCYHKLISPRKKVVRGAPIRRQLTGTYNLVSLDRKMPKHPLGVNDFMRIVSENAIVSDADSASSLHRILAQGSTTNIEPAVFASFYECWKGVIQENDCVDLPGIELEKSDKTNGIVQEKVLAVSSSSLRTNYGSQCQIILTTYRLLVVANFNTYVMADVRKQVRFEKTSLPLGILGSKTPAIRVEKMGHKDKKKEEFKDGSNKRHSLGHTLVRRKTQVNDVYIGYQNATDRESWYRMIFELHVGWSLSKARKDPGIIETAECHVILQNAVNQSGVLEQYSLAQRTKLSLKLLSIQTKDISEVSKFTVEALQYQINPCLHETERQTVESLLYIPPSDGGQGRLWIGLGNGRLKVYDMEARCFESDIKITESRYGRSVRLSCLRLVGRHVWVGSFSRTIHILDAETVCYVSQLPYLEDAPRDLELSQSEPQLVWSLLLNGVLLAWDPETRTRVTRLLVPAIEDGGAQSSNWTTYMCFTIWREHIWVGTNKGVLTVLDSQDGTCVKQIVFPGGGKRQVEIRHLAVSAENEVWCSVYSIPRSEDSTCIAVFDPRTHEKKMNYCKLDNRISIILPVNNTMWCGSKSGKIYIFHAKTYATCQGMPKVLSAHDDFIRAMTMTDIGLVISGSGSNDGYAAVWKATDIP